MRGVKLHFPLFFILVALIHETKSCCCCGCDCCCCSCCSNCNYQNLNIPQVIATTQSTSTTTTTTTVAPGKKKRSIQLNDLIRTRRLTDDENLEVEANKYAFSFKTLKDVNVPPELQAQFDYEDQKQASKLPIKDYELASGPSEINGARGGERLTTRLVSGIRSEQPPNKASSKP
ncbi:hypothetical protein M3Y96_00757400 [Aphelenchoides besseyi]|nr:hypothetical protein M3Y96_00757400 [Aphelenchoides besseyi]